MGFSRAVLPESGANVLCLLTALPGYICTQTFFSQMMNDFGEGRRIKGLWDFSQKSGRVLFFLPPDCLVLGMNNSILGQFRGSSRGSVAAPELCLGIWH